MFRYSKGVVYTIILIFLCGMVPLWAGVDPSVDRQGILRMTAGGILVIGNLLILMYAGIGGIVLWMK
jgi:predicted small integral membrane protein